MSCGPITTAPPARYVYAIAQASSALDGLTEIGGTSVEAVTCGRITAIASPVDDRQLQENLSAVEVCEGSPIADLARTHDSVVQAAFRHTTVIPMRLGTVFRARTELHEWLESRSPALVAELARLQDRAEWWVRVHRRMAAQRAPGPTASAAREPRGVGYLAARRDQLAARARGAAEERTQVTETIATLAGLADAVQPLSRGSALARAALLIPRRTEKAFAESVGRLSAALDSTSLALDISGPWAPAHFTDIEDVTHA